METRTCACGFTDKRAIELDVSDAANIKRTLTTTYYDYYVRRVEVAA